MKKNYLFPEAEWILLLSQDIIAESNDDTGKDIFDSDADDASLGQERDDVVTVTDGMFTTPTE